MSLEESLAGVRDRIDSARRRGGWADPVTLVAVTKGQTPDVVREALELGVRDVGENRVQEARGKWPALAEDFTRLAVRRHMIGHLQGNKVAPALALFDVIQSVDSISLADKISGLAVASRVVVPVLVQVNAGAEAAKHGFAREDLGGAVAHVAGLRGIELIGVMALAPLEATEAALRALFRDVRARFDSLRREQPALALRYLSMGMSGDFDVAVEEGATMVRVGSALFAGR